MRWRISIRPTSPARSPRSSSATRTRRCNSPPSIARASATRCWRGRANRCRHAAVLAIEPVPQAEADAPLKSDEAGGRFDPYSDYEFAAVPDEQLDVARYRSARCRYPPSQSLRDARVTVRARTGRESISAPIRWPRSRSRSRPGRRARRRWCWRRALRRSRHQAVGACAAGSRAATTRPARASPARAKSPASSSGRNRRPSGWRSPARRAPRRRSVSPTRSISKRAASRCAGRSRWRRW